ncbi:peptidoglycan synthetase FtsI [Candidatus Ruthia magnifica str. Cm (Calyptogena magnifica)]|uniref:Peptidoglycan synthetase FtsI n=1 Tax=Ruthia magnifica subsp. Calyptogena magnifica TaxID=413404 RepID=A1AVW9_RUTMC|nr:penicillin-binding protein 2 [Candidatus Ruthturnera calyptogenae]ABL02076.1 peptidoglycan synthetase FtsI [Candidatus Ruthia magnifica str. Cm (Calyptogena magnifica)]
MSGKISTISKALILRRVQNYWHRQGAIKYFFIFLFSVFSYQTTSISQSNIIGLSIQNRAYHQATSLETKIAQRGDILDRNGHILASNLLLKRLNLDPTLIQVEFIPKLARILDIKVQTLSKLLASKRKIGSKYLIIKKNITLTDPIINKLKQLNLMRILVCANKNITNKLSFIERTLNTLNLQKTKTTYTLVKQCKKARIAGVALQQDTKRYYPKSASLAPLLGRVNANKKGASGIEGEFENRLAGHNGQTLINFKANTNEAYFNSKTIIQIQQGQNIMLTIDTDIQYHAYEAIKKAVQKHESDSGSAIILTPNGEVLAMVNYPADNPNDNSTYNAEHYRNRVLSDKVEPGSTMKPFTMLLALDKNQITATEDEFIDVSKRIGHIKPDGKYKQMTIKKILQRSHNLGTVNISERLEPEAMYNTWNKLGFGHQLDLIPSIENSGSLRHFNSWTLSDKRTLSFGHGPMETNLAQLARAYLVFANKGAIPQLKLIKNTSTENITQVFNKQSIAKIAQLLSTVTSNQGSGYRAQIKGYNVAGKTGTAEMVVNGSYNKKGAKRTFFTGFVPVKKPKYIMAVRLDYPKKCYTSWNPNLRSKCEGSNSAAMVFKEAMGHILNNDVSIKLSMKN